MKRAVVIMCLMGVVIGCGPKMVVRGWLPTDGDVGG